VIEQVLLFAAAVTAFAIGGIVVGMLVAPRIGRMAERGDEDAGDGAD
jgi:hypothetical protein